MKTKVAILGTGNIGTDLLIKVLRSKFLECTLFVGQNPDSQGLQRARMLGVNTSSDSIEAIKRDPDCCRVVFDATSAQVHLANAPVLRKLGKFVIDLTPSKVGKMCIPMLNLKACLKENNVNLITCAGQAAVPLAQAIMQVHPETDYIEIVSSISSRSAGRGTRDNIDEFTATTRDALKEFTGVAKAKAIIILNPAEPPVVMHNTIYARITNPRMKELKERINCAVRMIAQYVPGYRLSLGPVEEGSRVTTMVEVVGSGDFLPRFSGNLDIITCAAVRVAEEFAR